MDLFGRQGFKATTVADIEKAAGLSPGAGGLYRHFASKRAVLEAGLREMLAAGTSRPPGADAREQLMLVARAGLARLQQERDLNRLLLRDLAAFPELLALVRDRELRTVHAGLLAWLETQPGHEGVDLAAVGAVLMGAVSHYWVMADVFSGEHPLAISEDRYLAVLVDMTTGLLGRT
jgi:AcrR family transcriptional regulator